jgi:hypothetical protein
MAHDNPLPIEKQLAARRAAAMQKRGFARALGHHAEKMAREADRELQDIETAERVFRGLPATESQAKALEQSISQEQLWMEAQHAATAEMRRQSRDDVIMKVDPEGASLRHLVTKVALHLLDDGKYMSIEELHLTMDSMGVPLSRVQYPGQRISQILSTDRRFKNQRGRGWTLKSNEELEGESEAQSGDRMTGKAAMDEWTERMRRSAREVVQKDNSAR